jgi:16S rRNA (guanine527-N7)-methyltransferase
MTEAEFAAAANVSRETLAALRHYADLLVKWNARINLVAPGTLPDLWSRHFLDSAQLLELAPESARLWVDLGSGGGFPGLVVAAIAAGKRPGLRVRLVESDQRKAAFLRTAAAAMQVEVEVLTERAETLAPQRADVVSARALAPLAALLPLARRHLAEGGVALFPKGANYRRELAEALALSEFNVQNYPSRTDTAAVVLKIGGAARD